MCEVNYRSPNQRNHLELEDNFVMREMACSQKRVDLMD